MVHLKFFKHFLVLEVLFASLFLPFSNFLNKLSIVRTLLMEKAMAPHSSTLAWKTPWMEEPGRLQSIGSQRVGHD